MKRKPAEVFHPGEHLLDELRARGLSERKFAEAMGLPYTFVHDIITGHADITPSAAKAIGIALGTSAELWINLQLAYNRSLNE